MFVWMFLPFVWTSLFLSYIHLFCFILFVCFIFLYFFLFVNLFDLFFFGIYLCYDLFSYSFVYMCMCVCMSLIYKKRQWQDSNLRLRRRSDFKSHALDHSATLSSFLYFHFSSCIITLSIELLYRFISTCHLNPL